MASDHVLSPELVLVDPALRRFALDALPPPGSVAGARSAGPCSPRRSPGVAGAVSKYAALAAVASVVVLVDSGVDALRGDPALRSRSSATEVRHGASDGRSVPANLETQTRARPPRQPTGAKAPLTARPLRPVRLAWAPTPGARAYSVELFRGASLVYRTTTDSPSLELPRDVRPNGTRLGLPGGSYRWYVWPILSGKRSTQAVVQATLVIP